MILTCPSCSTQYVVKDGAIPPQGRQVRCAACRHSWHQDPEPLALTEELEPESGGSDEDGPDEGGAAEPVATASAADANELVEMRADEPAVADDPDSQALQQPGPQEESRPAGTEVAEDDDFSPFADREPIEREPRGPLLKILLAVVLVAALAAAFWYLAPADWKERIGIAAGATPLQLMLTHSDRQPLASGNELLQVSGRVINPTDRPQPVPPITAELKSSSGKLIYSWTIAPPARQLPPRASATFNSAEVNVPAGGDELTITLGSPRA